MIRNGVAENGEKMRAPCCNGVVLFLALLLFQIYLGTYTIAVAGEWEAFEINAQYRGSVKQASERLGCAIGYFQGLGDGQNQVIFHACVQDPEKARTYYAFRVNETGRRADAVLNRTSEIYARFEGFEPSHQEAAKDFLLLLSELRRSDFEPKPEDSIEINRVRMRLSSTTKERGKRREVTVTRPGKPPVEGKFFFLRSMPNAPWGLEKFRLKRGKVSVSFVVQRLDAIRATYGVKSPFDAWVFAR
ncbi:MAG TPA: hypothetical protein PLU72_01460 [Candidatus Ozemobacteraceae bacterium]|nr:hypothetical protein [Candidatus Ozemobacteraceae bacterium]